MTAMRIAAETHPAFIFIQQGWILEVCSGYFHVDDQNCFPVYYTWDSS